jgi:branched-chain amino acid transport system substrate-binding protein
MRRDPRTKLKKLKTWARALLGGAGAALLAACAACAAGSEIPTVVIPPEPPPESTAQPAGRWKVGAYLSLSGPGRRRSIEMKEGIELAVAEINETGGVKSRPLEINYTDDQTNPSLVTNRVVELINIQRVIALLGDISAQSMSGATLADKSRIPILAPFSAEAQVTTIGPFVFRACAAEDAQARLTASFMMSTLGKKRLGLLYPADDPYSIGLARAFREEATRLGADAIIERSFGKDDISFAMLVLELMDEQPDVVYAPIEPGLMARVARTAMIAGVKGDMFFGAGAWGSGDLVREAGEALEGSFFADHWAPDAPLPASQAFVSKFRERYQREPGTPAALGYDAARILADAILRASASTPEAIRDALEETRGHSGVTGTISMDKAHNVEKPIFVRRIERGKLVYFTTLEPRDEE